MPTSLHLKPGSLHFKPGSLQLKPASLQKSTSEYRSRSNFVEMKTLQDFKMIINCGAQALVFPKARSPSIESRTYYRRPIDLTLPSFGVDSEFRP